MAKNISISLPLHVETFNENCQVKGRYQNASEVMRAALRLLEEEEKRFNMLSNAISEGIESGMAKNFDPKKHLAALKAPKKMKG